MTRHAPVSRAANRSSAALLASFGLAAFLIAAPGASSASESSFAAIPDDPSPDCWRAGLQSFQPGGHFTPALTLQAAPGSSKVALDYTVKLASVRLGDATVNSVPVAAIAPLNGQAWFNYYGPKGARRCVIPHAAFSDQAFVGLWNYAPLRLRLNGRDTLRYNVRSAIDYKNGSPDPVSIPHKAPYGGAGCDWSNMHTHGLLVRPNAPQNEAATGPFGDYVLALAEPAKSSEDACISDAPNNAAHVHKALPLMRHSVYIPPTPTSSNGDWLKLSPGAPAHHPAGLYFFHPHPHGYSAMQLSGATSAMLTIGDLKHNPQERDHHVEQNVRHILLRDMQVQKRADKIYDFNAEAKPAYCKDGVNSVGGNKGYCSNKDDNKRWYFTVNGQVYPLIDDIRAGEQEIWRVVNASPTVTYRLSVGKIDAAGNPVEADKMDLQLLTVDGAAALKDTPDKHSFPRSILLMPGARVEFKMDAPVGGGERLLFSDKVVVSGDPAGDVWQPVALARIQWPSAAPHVSMASMAVSRETTAGGRQMAGRYQNFTRLNVSGPDFSKVTPPNPSPYKTDFAACRDLTGRTHERVVHFVKNPDANVGGKDLFGLITGVRMAGDVDPASPDTAYFRHNRDDNADVQTPISFAEVQGLNKPGDKVFTPAFGQTEDAGTICATLQRDETYSELWVIENWTNEIHNFHLHQSKFSIYHNRAAAYLNMPCKSDPAGCNDTDKLIATFYEDTSFAAHDTVPVPRGVGDKCDGTIRSPGPDCNPGRVTIEVRFGRPQMIGQDGFGDFVFHCHILEHEDRGMMGKIRVIDPAIYRPAKKVATTAPTPVMHKH